MERILVVEVLTAIEDEKARNDADKYGIPYEPETRLMTSWVKASSVISITASPKNKNYVWMDVAEAGTLDVKMDPELMGAVFRFCMGHEVEGLVDPILPVSQLSLVKQEDEVQA